MFLMCCSAAHIKNGSLKKPNYQKTMHKSRITLTIVICDSVEFEFVPPENLQRFPAEIRREISCPAPHFSSSCAGTKILSWSLRGHGATRSDAQLELQSSHMLARKGQQGQLEVSSRGRVSFFWFHFFFKPKHSTLSTSKDKKVIRLFPKWK